MRFAAHRAKLHGERKLAASGGLWSEEFFRGSERAGSGCAGHGGVRRSVLSRKCRGGLWRAKHAAGGPQPGKKFAEYSGPENGRAFLRRISADIRKSIGADGNHRCVQQVERRSVCAGCTRIDGAGSRRECSEKYRRQDARSFKSAIESQDFRGTSDLAGGVSGECHA